jgi:alkanesulfonate monooxygenase SsuD/methylene tetrahydromethanopterin reductase-like flavin-dependent oxidoreductase (luciferase family)
MALAIIGGLPERFAPFAEIHRRAAVQAGHDPAPQLGISSHGYVAESSKEAADDWFLPFATTMTKIGRERGWPPLTRQDYDASLTLRGANLVGSPEQIVEKILFQHEIFRHDRFLLQITVGSMPHAKVMRAIELFGTEVAPAVREEVALRVRSPANGAPPITERFG